MRFLSTFFVLAALPAAADDFEVDASRSVFSLVTHKAGLAAGLAHNHLMYPGRFDAELRGEGEAIESGRFRLRFAATDLVVDDPQAQAKWYPRIEDLGILDEPFKTLSEKDRGKVREAMLSDKQLDAAKYPELGAEVKAIRKAAAQRGSLECTHAAVLAFTVHGRTVEREFPVRIEVNGDTVQVEGAARYRFTEFNIEPYSALMGAIRVKDEFDIYVNLTARRQAAAGGQ